MSCLDSGAINDIVFTVMVGLVFCIVAWKN